MNVTVTLGATYALIEGSTLKYETRSALLKILARMLCVYEWNPRIRRMEKGDQYFTYDPKTKEMRFPIEFYESISSCAMVGGIKFSRNAIPPNESRRIAFTSNKGWEPRENQLPPINHLAQTNGRVGITAQTGFGKTAITIFSLVKIGDVPMIVCSGLTDQWLEALREQTNAGDFIYVIKGYKSIINLMKSDFMPEVFICSLETLREFAKGEGNYEDIPSYPDFIKHYGIGVKVIDECHLNFKTCVNLDLVSNVKKNVYLTATMDRSNRDVKKIFDQVYPANMRFSAGAYEKYARCICYGYNGWIMEKKCVTNRGYSHSNFESQMLKIKGAYDEWTRLVILPILYQHYVNDPLAKGKKCLLFFRTIDMCNAAMATIKAAHPEKNVVTYVASDPDSNLDEGDIIISTHGSAGTGTDIKNLYSVIDTISYKASNTVKQVFGRLRKLKCGTAPLYIGMLDLNMVSHERHYAARKTLLIEMAVDFKEYKI